MACTLNPIPFPDLPSGIDLTPPALPSFSFNPEWCCKIQLFDWSPKLPPAGLALNPAAVAALAALKTTMDLVNIYISKLPLKCPRE